MKPLEERHTQTREEALAWIQTGLASRAAEELFLGTRMSGGYGDLSDCTMLAYQMLTMWGADGSLFSYGPWGMGQLDAETKTRVEQVLEQEFKKAKALLAKYAGAMHEIAEGLVEHDELDGEDVIEILAKHDELIASGQGPRILPQYALSSAGGISGGVRGLLGSGQEDLQDGSSNGRGLKDSSNGAESNGDDVIHDAEG